MTSTLLITGIIVLATSGYAVASYVNKKKTVRKKLICPLRSNCEMVIHSKYSTLLGMRLERIGMLYYAFMLIGYLGILMGNVPELLPNILFGASACAFLLSVYLLSVQAFIIRQWCTWCIFSALISLSIFILSLHLYTL